MTIPKIIHQIWIHDADLPLNVYKKTDIQSWQVMNPEWKYVLWDKAACDEIISTSFPEMKNAYSRASYVIKSDICRVAILIKYGGIYTDLDTLCLKSYDDTIDEVKTIRNNSNSFLMSPIQSVYLKLFFGIYPFKTNTCPT